MSFMSRCFSARVTSKASSETSCSKVNVRSSCQDEGASVRGINNDFDTPVGDCVEKQLVLLIVTEVQFGVLIDCPMNIPTTPAVPTDMIPVIDTRERQDAPSERTRSRTYVELTPFE